METQTGRRTLRRLGVLGVTASLAVAACRVDTGPDQVGLTDGRAADEVALEMAGPGDAAVLVPVFVNGEGPFAFVLDTGATLTCVDVRLAERLALPRMRETGMGAGVGGMQALVMVEVDSIRVGAALAEGIPACALDLAHAERVGVETDGLLGLNFLRAFRVTIDFDRGALHLEAP